MTVELEKAEDRPLSIRIKGDTVRFKDKIIVDKLFSELLHNLCYELGIREALEKRDVDSIFTYLTRNFGLIKLEQINEAFDLYSSQQLDFKDSHFNSFDRIFIGKVLTSYYKFKDTSRKKPKRYEPEDNRRTPYSDEEGKKAFDHIEQIVTNEGVMPWIACWIHACKWMEENGVIEMDEVENEASNNAIQSEWAQEKTRKRNDLTDALERMVFDNTFELKRAKVLIKRHFIKQLTKNNKS